MPDRPAIDAREVDRIEAIVTADDADRADDFLARCVPGSTWVVRIRTAEVEAKVLARSPLGTFDERVCTCLSLPPRPPRPRRARPPDPDRGRRLLRPRGLGQGPALGG